MKPGEKVKMGQALGYIHASPEVEAICHGIDQVDCTFVEMENESESDEQQSVGALEQMDVMDDESIELEETEDYQLEEVEDEEEINPTPVYRMKSIRTLFGRFAQRY